MILNKYRDDVGNPIEENCSISSIV